MFCGIVASLIFFGTFVLSAEEKAKADDPALVALTSLILTGIEFTRIDNIGGENLQNIAARLGTPLSRLYNIHLQDGNAQINVAVVQDAAQLPSLKKKFMELGQPEANLIELPPRALIELTPRNLTEARLNEVRVLVKSMAEPKQDAP